VQERRINNYKLEMFKVNLSLLYVAPSSCKPRVTLPTSVPRQFSGELCGCISKQGSVVGIATICGDTGFELRGRQIFSLLQNFPERFWDPPGLSFNMYCGFFLLVKRLGCEVNQSPTSSAEVKNEWSYTSTPPICLHGVDRENFVF
jgi:hypothetical protein